jgi:hypothetical protein
MNTTPENPPLPKLQDAILDTETLERLMQDIQSFAVVEEVLLKGGAVAMASEQSVPLAEALEVFRQGRVLGVQIRYRFQGTSWWDTLLRTSGGIRLVRIEHVLP